MGFLNASELEKMNFKSLGKNPRISDKCSIYNAHLIEIGDNFRVDDFAILSAGKGGIMIGRNVHISPYSSLIGTGRMEMHDYSGLSSRVAIYSSSDDYSGKFMTNPAVPDEFTNAIVGDVVLEKHVIIGVGSTILPGVTVGYGTAIGALSLVAKNVEPMVIAAGCPLKIIKKRDNGFEAIEKKLVEKYYS